MPASTDVVALTRRLVDIDATNPSLVAGGAGERELAELVSAWLDAQGFEVRLVGADPARPSVLARRRGSGGGRTLLLAGHLDTVGGTGRGASGRADAEGEGDADGGGAMAGGLRADGAAGVAPDRIVGRGAYDMAGGLAAAMVAAATASDGLAGDVVLAFAADEEFGSLGMEELVAEIRSRADRPEDADRAPDGAVVLEPTDLGVTLAHRGFAWYRVEYDGVAAHGSQPDLGVDAIDRALDGLLALRTLGLELETRPRHPLLGTGSVRVATIDGGTDAATVADRCVLVVERRTLPGDADPGAELERVLAASEPARIVRLVSRPAMEAEAGAAIVRSVLGAVERVTGAPAARRGDPWWTDAGLLAHAGIPVVLVGPVGGGAHADEEWVSIASLETLTAVIGLVIEDFCGPSADGDPAR
jgi:acetylornithine deacetylase/succinyl-diaminopimelate desuccinylase-like protein